MGIPQGIMPLENLIRDVARLAEGEKQQNDTPFVAASLLGPILLSRLEVKKKYEGLLERLSGEPTESTAPEDQMIQYARSMERPEEFNLAQWISRIHLRE